MPCPAMWRMCLRAPSICCCQQSGDAEAPALLAALMHLLLGCWRMLTPGLCAAPQEWMLTAGQSSAGADDVADGLGDAIGRSAPAAVSFAEFVRCYQWCGHPLQYSAQACSVCMHGVWRLTAPAPEADRMRFKFHEVHMMQNRFVPAQADVHAPNACSSRHLRCSAVICKQLVLLQYKPLSAAPVTDSEV